VKGARTERRNPGQTVQRDVDSQQKPAPPLLPLQRRLQRHRNHRWHLRMLLGRNLLRRHQQLVLLRWATLKLQRQLKT
jgi:hypothetical protein